MRKSQFNLFIAGFSIVTSLAVGVPNHYEVLGVSRNVTTEGLARAYISKLDSARTSDERLAIQTAYSVLNGPRRFTYDLELNEETAPERAAETKAQLLANMQSEAGIRPHKRAPIAAVLTLISSQQAKERALLVAEVELRKRMQPEDPDELTIDSRESDEHAYFREELTRLAEDVILGSPNTKQIVTYLNGLAGSVARYNQVQRFYGLKTTALATFERVLTYGFLHAVTSRDEFHDLFEFALDINSDCNGKRSDDRRLVLGENFTVNDAAKLYRQRFGQSLAPIAISWYHQRGSRGISRFLQVIPALGPDLSVELLKQIFQEEFPQDPQSASRFLEYRGQDFKDALSAIEREFPEVNKARRAQPFWPLSLLQWREPDLTTCKEAWKSLFRLNS